MRANLIFSYKGANKSLLLVSAPADLDFELFIISCAMNLVSGMLKSKYPTSLEEDYELVQAGGHSYRMQMALVHRVNQKEILRE